MIEQRIKEANGRLKHNNFGISIELIGGKLWLRGILPPKPNSKKAIHHQQRIKIAAANSSGLKLAESEAKKLSLRLNSQIFSWADYMDIQKSPALICDWLSRFEEDYFNRRQRNFKSESTWRKDYLEVFNRLPSAQLLTVDVLQELILTTEPDTRTRKRYCMVLGVLARFAKLEDFNFKNYSGSYTPKSRKFRDLPPDHLITEWFFKIENQNWRWVFGVLATYGLRNHEVFFIDQEELSRGNEVLSVLDGKTGYRRIWPFHPEWVGTFDLFSVKLPKINLNRNNSDIGNTVTQHFRRNQKIPFQVYDLRHAWAVRTLEYGIDITLAAQQMGHSLQVHSNLYHSWITAKVHQRAFDLAMSKSDRPQPPNYKNQ